MSLTQKQQSMKKRHSGAVHEVTLHSRERIARPRPEWTGPKTKRVLMREGLETRVRDLRARLEHFEERKREQYERRYAVPITIVPSEQQLQEMSRYQR